MSAVDDCQEWDDILDFWLPEARSLSVEAQTHLAHWLWRRQGGADAEILARFSEITERAARGDLDQWARHPHGGWALIILLD